MCEEMISVIGVLFVILNLSCAEYKDYSRHKKIYVQHDNELIYKQLIELEQNYDTLDFWLLSRNSSIILVPPEIDQSFQYLLKQIGANFNETVLADEENEIFGNASEKHRSKRQSQGFFGTFQRYSTIFQYMQRLAQKHSKHARFDAVSKTAEGRQLAVLRIAPYRRTGKKLIYIQGGSHAREWISITTVLYFVTQLLENFDRYQNLLKGIEIGVVPVLNPDGYEHTHTRDRLWRKNRSVSRNGCRGSDLNRNFGFKWGTVGSSLYSCSEVFAGRGPFSEAETDWVRRYLIGNQYRTKLVLDFHSFGKYLFYPWGYHLAPAPTKSTLHKIGLQVARAIYNVRGTKYTVGSPARLLYSAAGGLDDYAYGTLGIPLSYTFELPGNSFRSSAGDIIPIGKETFAGVIEFLRIVKDL